MATRQQVCRYFQRGSCLYGDACKYSHGKKSGKSCHAFAKGVCHQGTQCIYSHERSASQQVGSRPDHKAQHQSSGSSTYDQFVQWRYDIKKEKRDIERAQPLGRRFPGFIHQALALVDSVETMQEVITSLSGEGGLARIGELLNADLEVMTDDALYTIFSDSLLPFLRIVSHDAVLSSAVLESRHATLLNYLYGINGKRSVAVFRAAIRALTYNEQSPSDLEPCLIALSAVLEVNGSAQINDDLRAAGEAMIALANHRTLSGASLRYHRKLCLRLGLGESIMNAKIVKRDSPARPNPVFELSMDQPGDLSEHGPRHDNDSSNIGDIQILPTMEEILGDRAEYLPRSHPSTWHLPGVAGLLDRQFRLMREDTVGQLRDAAKLELARLQEPSRRNSATRHAGTRTYSYRNVRLVSAEFDEHKGLLCALQFSQPHELDGKTAANRTVWWSESKRLAPEALIMLLGSDQVAVFLTVVATANQPGPKFKTSKEEEPIEQRFPRSGDNGLANVVVQLVNRTEADVETMLFRFGLGDDKISFSLLEFPGVLLPAFQPTLAALQQMSKTQDLPFAELLATTQDMPRRDVDTPAYTRLHDFRYDLSTLSSRNETIKLDVSSPIDASVLSSQTTLDNAQANALISTLCRSMALMQGPPGTGKSYTGVALMKVLLANKAAAKLGPVICVTFTNHALDQILEHLVDANVKQVIRIGSRSKSERLVALNLRTVAQDEALTKLEKRTRWQTKKDLENYGRLLNASLCQMQNAYSDDSIMKFLRDNHPNHYAQLTEPEVDEDNFEFVQSRKAPRGLQAWLSSAPRSFRKLPHDKRLDIFSLSPRQRHKMYSGWKKQIMDPIKRSLLANLKAYQDAKSELDQIRAEVDLRVLAKANVIGVTTSGLARNLSLLRKLNSKVLLVEEAGEVLEAHLLTAMLPSIEHAILIGDHQQLRPKAQNYELSCENPRSQIKLDLSLFERLVKSEDRNDTAVPYVTLEVQRRMHPSISTLIRSTLYPHLQNSPEVASYPEVPGMRRRLFWLDHKKPEDGENHRADSTSHTNQYEVDMVFALVRHLVRQGVYMSSDIAVLTPYLGQLRKLRLSLSSFAEVMINDRDTEDLSLDGDNGSIEETSSSSEARLAPRPGVHMGTLLQALRLATVDNFQGMDASSTIIITELTFLRRRRSEGCHNLACTVQSRTQVWIFENLQSNQLPISTLR